MHRSLEQRSVNLLIIMTVLRRNTKSPSTSPPASPSPAVPFVPSHCFRHSVGFTCLPHHHCCCFSGHHFLLLSCGFAVCCWGTQGYSCFSGETHPDPQPLTSPPSQLPWGSLGSLHSPRAPGTFRPGPKQAALILSCSLQGTSNQANCFRSTETRKGGHTEMR